MTKELLLLGDYVVQTLVIVGNEKEIDDDDTRVSLSEHAAVCRSLHSGLRHRMR